MLTRLTVAFVATATLTVPSAVLGQTDSEIPTPDALVQRAWDAAGGLETFGRLGILAADVTTEETTTDGTSIPVKSRTYMLVPGPAPGRIEIENPPVVSGDDGTGGWALVNGKLDNRPSTKYMVKRLVATNMFAMMLPFSLNWDGVTLGEVTPTTIKGVPVWRLSIAVAQSFFHSPQIATTWRIDFDRKTYAVVQAESPATNLGRGILADGMRISWEKREKVQGVMLPVVQQTIGLSETGTEKPHWKRQLVAYELLEPDRNPRIFSNPVPPDKRPKLPVGQPPPAMPPHA